jgi:beta-ketoacyl-acyl-carrier-protein synthase II
VIKVVVTGLGVASPLGIGVDRFWERLLAGQSGVRSLDESQFQSLPSRIGARVDDDELEPFTSIKDRRRMSRASQLALAAADEAIRGAGLEGLSEETKTDIAVIIGSSIGGFAASDPVFKEYYQNNKQSSLIIPISMNSAPSANVSIRYGFKGPQMTADAACAASAHSIGLLYNMIRSGSVEIGITGGADSPFGEAVMQAWCNLRVVSERNDDPAGACRPFSADRDGMVLGEGSAILVLESEESARRRNAPILAEIKGYGASSDGQHITRPSQDGPVRAMRLALRDAGISPAEIDHINAHGTATLINDRIETAAIKDVFGERAYGIPIVAIKAAIGHSIGASGALELAACVQALRTRMIPPTINYHAADPDCDLDYVTTGCRRLDLSNIMSNSFAFGGSNASLIVGL